MNPIIISTCDVNKDVKFTMISTLDLSEYTEIGSYPDQFKPKLRRIDLGNVSKEVIEKKNKKELKS